jgi:RimJ/RimL family protein N-acetyltransferase
MIVCETERLIIRHFELNDADYVLKQLNEESFIQFIADKNVRNLIDAKKYLQEGPLSSYKTHGFGLNIVLLRQSNTAIGMCGLVKRDGLEHPDLGFAFLPDFWGKGYAMEANKAILNDAVMTHNLKIILGITLPENSASNCLLTRLGFEPSGSINLYGSEDNLYQYQPNC